MRFLAPPNGPLARDSHLRQADIEGRVPGDGVSRPTLRHPNCLPCRQATATFSHLCEVVLLFNPNKLAQQHRDSLTRDRIVCRPCLSRALRSLLGRYTRGTCLGFWWPASKAISLIARSNCGAVKTRAIARSECLRMDAAPAGHHRPSG